MCSATRVVVWSTGGIGSIAVRADRCRLGAAQDGPHVTGQVVAVEYQGAMVRVAVMTDAGDEVSALVPDQMFYQKPAEPGEFAWRAFVNGKIDL